MSKMITKEVNIVQSCTPSPFKTLNRDQMRKPTKKGVTTQNNMAGTRTSAALLGPGRLPLVITPRDL